MVLKNHMEDYLIGETSNLFINSFTLSNSLEYFLFLSYTYFSRVAFNQAQQNVVVGLIPFLFISELEQLSQKSYC